MWELTSDAALCFFDYIVDGVNLRHIEVNRGAGWTFEISNPNNVAFDKRFVLHLRLQSRQPGKIWEPLEFTAAETNLLNDTDLTNWIRTNLMGYGA